MVKGPRLDHRKDEAIAGKGGMIKGKYRIIEADRSPMVTKPDETF